MQILQRSQHRPRPRTTPYKCRPLSISFRKKYLHFTKGRFDRYLSVTHRRRTVPEFFRRNRIQIFDPNMENFVSFHW
jgi:hypothetical protein